MGPMCGRFIYLADESTFKLLFQVSLGEPVAAAYNICPSQDILAVRVRESDGAREAARLRWGLVPRWAKDPAIGNKLANARSETVAEKPSFRDAFRKRRCLVPMDGFYEWRRTTAAKQPFLIRMRSHEAFAVAGLHERWTGPAGADGTARVLETVTLLTTGPNALMAPIHDRMPVILAPRDFDLWLDPSVRDREGLARLMVPFDDTLMECHAVSNRVNSPRNQGPDLIEAVVPAAPLPEQDVLFPTG